MNTKQSTASHKMTSQTSNTLTHLFPLALQEFSLKKIKQVTAELQAMHKYPTGQHFWHGFVIKEMAKNHQTLDM